MGSIKVKTQVKYFLIRALPPSDQITSRAQKSKRLSIWYPGSTVLWASQALPSTAHTAGLRLRPALFSQCSVPDSHLLLRARPVSWGFHCHWGCTFTNGFSWPLAVPGLSCSPRPLQSSSSHGTWNLGDISAVPGVIDTWRCRLGTPGLQLIESMVCQRMMSCTQIVCKSKERFYSVGFQHAGIYH